MQKLNENKANIFQFITEDGNENVNDLNDKQEIKQSGKMMLNEATLKKGEITWLLYGKL